MSSGTWSPKISSSTTPLSREAIVGGEEAKSSTSWRVNVWEALRRAVIPSRSVSEDMPPIFIVDATPGVVKEVAAPEMRELGAGH